MANEPFQDETYISYIFQLPNIRYALLYVQPELFWISKRMSVQLSFNMHFGILTFHNLTPFFLRAPLKLHFCIDLYLTKNFQNDKIIKSKKMFENICLNS